MKKFCTNCGNKLDDNGKCPNCNTNTMPNKKKGLPTWATVLIIVGSILVSLIVIFIILFCFYRVNKKQVNYDYGERSIESYYVEEITYDEYQEMVDDNEEFLLVITRTGCTYCNMYMPVVEEISSDENVDFYYIDIAYLTDSELDLFESSNEYLSENELGTPTTLYMRGNRVIDSISGYVEEDELEDFLEDNGIIW